MENGFEIAALIRRLGSMSSVQGMKGMNFRHNNLQYRHYIFPSLGGRVYCTAGRRFIPALFRHM